MLVAAGLVSVGTIAGVYLWNTRPQQIAPRKTTQTEMTERLRALPYARWQEIAPDDSLGEGILRHDPARSFRGATLYTLEDESVARLVDMDGVTPLDRAGWNAVHPDPRAAIRRLPGRQNSDPRRCGGDPRFRRTNPGANLPLGPVP